MQKYNSKLKNFNFYVLVLPFTFCLLTFIGCATAPSVTPPPAPRLPSIVKKPAIEGVYHKVKKGETLWRISKIYNVDLEAIVTANRLKDTTKIEVGQQIFIPGGKEREDVYTNNFTLGSKPDFIWPVKGKVISVFGAKQNGVINKGIDIQVKSGSEVVAARSGKVTFIDENLKGYGKTIIIDHQDGYSTVYTNNSEILVKIGQVVAQNFVIAKAGSSGRATTSCLHFEIRKKYKPQNPFYYLP